MPDPTHIDPELLAGLADHYSITQEEATERLVRGVTGKVDPVRLSGPPTVDGPPCLRCGGDLHDHILAAGPNGGDDEYRCLRDELQDVLHDMETSEPADDGDRVDPHWVEIVQAVAVAYERSLVSVEGPIVVDRAQHMADLLQATDGVGDPEVFGSTEIGAQAADLARVTTHTTFAVLRDIADAEPVTELHGLDSTLGAFCVLCGGESDEIERSRLSNDPLPPVTHLISCPWARAVQIVGVKDGG